MTSPNRSRSAAAYLILCLTLGGASAAGILANAALQIGAAVLLVLVAITAPARPVDRAEKQAWALAAGFVFLALAQLMPLPPDLWTSLPGRADVAQGFALLGTPLPWLPMSLTPDGTLRALLSLLPALALLALVAPCGALARRPFLPLVLAAGGAALLLGLAQWAAGPQSPLHFYANTNRGHTVGFFANRNHQATLMLMLLPFVAGLATPLLQGGRVREEAVPKIVIIALLFAIVAGGVATTGSRAGIALLPIMAGLCGLMVRKDLTGNVPRSWVAAAGLLLAAGLAAVAASGVVTRDALSAGNVAASTRETIWANTWRLALDFQPPGSGLGSFVPLYQSREDPLNRPDEFTNHAHNDYLEWLLETGMPGLALMLAFLVWFALRVKRVWTSDQAGLGRAASIAIGAVLLHSMVDYPIRTAAVSALCGLCLALMIPPPERAR